MPTETRLLYILEDLAYIAKLVPSKKPNEFNLADFHQINGEFLDENTLITENLSKLVTKLEAGSYKVVLPDFLFTSTVVNPELEDEAAVKKYLNEKLLPDLNIDKANFYLDTTILNHYKGVFKVQLTALEKIVVLPLVKALKERSDIKVESISPLSWTAKSLISLEPSVSILQLGRQLYLAQHYIGLDQCFNTGLDEAANFAETVKTLKGVEPNLQTLYLLSNELVDSKIKEALKDTLPVQQLADYGKDTSQLPSHLKKIIEAGAKTIAIPEFLLPQFALDLDFDQEVKEEMPAKDKKEKDEKVSENMVKPAVVGDVPEKKEEVVPEEKEEVTEKVEENKEAETALPEPSKIEPVIEKEVAALKATTEVAPELTEDKKEIEEVAPVSLKEEEPVIKKEIKEVDLAQFANLAIDPSVVKKEVSGSAAPKKEETPMSEQKEVIKNESEASGMLKMIFIALLSFVVTIGLGIGIGLGYLQLSNNKVNQEPVIEVETESPTPTPTAEPTPIPVEINKDDYSLMVVNATTTAGYAGEMADKLEEAGFSDVVAQNAKGTYDSVNYLLVNSLEDEAEASNAALLQEVEAATDLVVELSDEISTEDSAGSYDAVLVLGE